jgi:hypothetical protein
MLYNGPNKKSTDPRYFLTEGVSGVPNIGSIIEDMKKYGVKENATAGQLLGYFVNKSRDPNLTAYDKYAFDILESFYNGQPPSISGTTQKIKKYSELTSPDLYELVNAYGAAAESLIYNRSIPRWAPFKKFRKTYLSINDATATFDDDQTRDAWNAWTAKIKGGNPST